MVAKYVIAVPVGEPEFYSKRLEDAIAAGKPPEWGVWQAAPNVWDTCRRSAVALLKDCAAGKVLDAGCGLGELANAFPNAISYTGVDNTKEFVELANKQHGSDRVKFLTADLRSLPFPDDSFDLAVCLGVEGCISSNMGSSCWNRMRKEILRVAPKLLVLGADGHSGEVSKTREYARGSDVGSLHISVYEQLRLFERWLKDGDPFCHLRFNDGEAITAFNLGDPRETCSGEHHRFRDLGAELLRVLGEMAGCGLPRVMAGSDCWRERGDYRWANALRNWAKITGKELTWSAGDVWYSTDGESDGLVQDCKPLLRLLASKNAVLVCNSTVAGAVKLFKRKVIVPQVDAWLDKAIPDKVAALLADGPAAVVCWCAGLPAKVWGWDLWKRFPASSCLDLGHFLDLAAGLTNRAWQGRDGPHRAAYIDLVAPVLKGEP